MPKRVNVSIDVGSNNMQNSDGYALISAANLGDVQRVSELIRMVTVDFQDEEGYTPLMKASARGNYEVVKLLLQQRAQVDLANNEGDTALMKASLYGRERVAFRLLERGADVNATNAEGETCLLAACREGHEEVAQLLVEHGAKVNVKGRFGMTPLLWVSGLGKEKIARLLVEHKADVIAQNDNGYTPLMKAVSKGNEHTARFLAENMSPFEINAKDRLNRTVMSYTHDCSDYFRLWLIQERGAIPAFDDGQGSEDSGSGLKKAPVKMRTKRTLFACMPISF